MTKDFVKSLDEHRAQWDAEMRERWEAAETDLSFSEWKKQEFERRRAEQFAEDDARRKAEAHALRVEALSKQIPPRYRNATTDHAELTAWVQRLLTWSQELSSARRPVTVEGWGPTPYRSPTEPDVETQTAGPSLLLLGPTGVGKTHQAFAALRQYVAEGGMATIRVATSADMYAELRPRPGVDSEEVFGRYAKCPVLFIDDLGAAKSSEWVEEINYRLINYRWNHQLATLITSNVPTRQLGEYLGERVASRLNGMCSTTVLKGDDRRRAA
ncbi:hypothetical protein BAY59_24360 [Prauserella coralliicola]|nr:hypothetical protein BAY59_24360 [Prauserella coralliicola]